MPLAILRDICMETVPVTDILVSGYPEFRL
jgi:hypothetical protein